ncbi:MULTISPECIES: DUF1194 domain-containing protein [Alphaproteobacteria]|uniref:DUF1194 domain-containing protein n=1 Tax=Alphaproteobacteria TaxID=28211 RepID=UPI0012BB50B3|nr:MULTISPECIES: DUF1194 domain-containing protein [Alphaproteobacteria]MTI03072.1 DUF1194 domain-containing protein [Roseibium sp. RKSG952]
MHILRAATLASLFATQSVACDLALALAVDVSGSVDTKEYRIQMDGLAAGLRDPVVSEALVRGQARLMLVQWTGASRQRTTIPWTYIDSFETLDRFAGQVATDPRVWRNFSTAIGEALETTMASFDAVSECKRHLIDISGDGISNEGVEPSELHALLRHRGVTVNAIAIEESEPDLTAYFFENVIVGEGAFVVSAAGFADYPERIRKKLLREVTQQTADLR